MIKYLFLLLACLTGGTLAATGDIDTQTQLYIVAGILGGACLLLTIASIYNSVTIIGLQSKIAVLQAAGAATVKAVSNVVENSPRTPKKFPDHEAPHTSGDRDPYSRDDPYRRQDSRGYRMERQPSRGYQDDRRPPSGYY
ncbi:uncharacterized protein LOC135213524 isoform X3 [Macrobrachium nipponense]|uniref:uncharacterized protein LOC135213524 isoform X3 n=1 Tax=Macrobrachium nipponense TaxID=159736 RepID=UPI0030C7C4D8